MPHPEPRLPVISLPACIACGDCASVCPSNALSSKGGTPFFSDPCACTFCGNCEVICPTGAVELIYDLTSLGGVS